MQKLLTHIDQVTNRFPILWNCIHVHTVAKLLGWWVRLHVILLVGLEYAGGWVEDRDFSSLSGQLLKSRSSSFPLFRAWCHSRRGSQGTFASCHLFLDKESVRLPIQYVMRLLDSQLLGSADLKLSRWPTSIWITTRVLTSGIQASENTQGPMNDSTFWPRLYVKLNELLLCRDGLVVQDEAPWDTHPWKKKYRETWVEFIFSPALYFQMNPWHFCHQIQLCRVNEISVPPYICLVPSDGPHITPVAVKEESWTTGWVQAEEWDGKVASFFSLSNRRQ